MPRTAGSFGRVGNLRRDAMVAGMAGDTVLRPLPEVLRELRTSPEGLTAAEASARLVAHGPNELAGRRGPSLLAALVRQLIHPLALLLWVAAVLALATVSTVLGVGILLVIALNAALAVVQERHAEHAVAALSAYLPPHAVVLRDRQRTAVEARTIVPGDVVIVGEGDAICADAKIVSGAWRSTSPP